MSAIVMEAEVRDKSGKGPNRRLRAAGKLPAVLYGNKDDTVPLSVDPDGVKAVIRSHGGVNTIFQLDVKGKGVTSVMIRDYQLDPVEHELLHADLIRVAMDKELELSVHVELKGVPEGVKIGGGMLDFISRTVDIACLPTDIPETIEADVSLLEIGDYLRASDLKVPDNVRLLSDAQLVLAHLIPPRVEETPEEEVAEGEAAAEGAEASDAPGDGKEKKEKAEGDDK